MGNMKKRLLYTAFVILLGAVVILCCGCEKKVSGTYGVIKDEKLGGLYADISIEEFTGLGFDFGDSVDIAFDNGKEISGVPFYNGYYTRTGELLICGYPGYEHVRIGRNNGNDIWEEFGIGEDTKVTLTLRQKGKYKVMQETMNTVYLNDRSGFESDEAFANYRTLSGGTITAGAAYRGVSPADNQYNRAPFADALIKRDGIGFILDLADSEEDIAAYLENGNYDFENSYFRELEKAGRVALLDMPASFGGEVYMSKLGDGLRKMISFEGPYYIHCTEGKDRTGFVCLLLEALCGASYDELLGDYMTTYDNYYGINENDTPEKYRAIVELKFRDMVEFLSGENSEDILRKLDYHGFAEDYLKKCGLDMSEIGKLKEILAK